MSGLIADGGGDPATGKKKSEYSGLQVAYQVEFSTVVNFTGAVSTASISRSINTPLHTLYWVRKWIHGLTPKLTESGARQVLDWLGDIDSASKSVESLTIAESYLVAISDSNGIAYTATVTPVLCLPLIGVHEIREDDYSWVMSTSRTEG